MKRVLCLGVVLLGLFLTDARAQAPVVSLAPPLRAYGTLALTTASVAASTLTAGSNSGAWTASFTGSFTVISRSTSAGSAYVCVFGGTCSSSNGIEVPPGSYRSFNFNSAQSPTIVAASTATVEMYQ